MEQAAFSVPSCLEAWEGAAAALTAKLQTAHPGLGAEGGPAASSLASWMEILSWALWGAQQKLQAELPQVSLGVCQLCIPVLPPPKHWEKQALLQAGSVLEPLSFKGAVELLSCCVSWERLIPACLLLTSVSVRSLPGRKEGIPGWWRVL